MTNKITPVRPLLHPALFAFPFILAASESRAQHRSDSTFSALEERCTPLPDGSSDCYTGGGPGSWPHLATISFLGDSVFMTQVPVSITGKDTLQSPSDVYSRWKGTVERRAGTVYLSLQMAFCIGCPMNMQRDRTGKWVPARSTKTYTGFTTALGLRLNGILFRRED